MDKKPCRFFGGKNGCPKGDECPFLHQKTKNRRCRFFSSNQGCPYGFKCSFTHEPVLLEKHKLALNKQTNEQTSKKRKVLAPLYFCPVCKEQFENWENAKAHFEETAHIGAHCVQCGRTFVVMHHRNLHEKETGHDIFKGVLVQEVYLKEIPEEVPRTISMPSNDPATMLIDRFYHGGNVSLDNKNLTEDYVVSCLEWMVGNNVYKGTVKHIGIQLLLALEDVKVVVSCHDRIKGLIQRSMEENQDLQFLFQMNHVYRLDFDFSNIAKFKQEKVELKELEAKLDNEITEYSKLKDEESFDKAILIKFEKEKPTQQSMERIGSIVDTVTTVVRSLWKDAEIQLFGSTVWGLFDSNSDVDINVNISDKYMLTEKHALLQLDVIFKKQKLERVSLVLNSRVPLISVVIDGTVVDIVVNKVLNIKKTNLVAEYILGVHHSCFV
jgi:predicted nucleotidyltransferase